VLAAPEGVARLRSFSTYTGSNTAGKQAALTHRQVACYAGIVMRANTAS
jgi:hypothetical protein